MRKKIYEIIFEAETRSGRIFDIALLWLILLSVASVSLESVESLNQRWHSVFLFLEWTFTILFSIEYLIRLICVKKPLRYVFSFFGLIDLIALIPTYLSLLVSGGGSLLVIRGFRLLRIFRLLKLGRYVGEADILLTALKASRFKITIFLVAVLSLAITIGAAMYLIEGRENGFTSIPYSIYWAIVTMTTVGYGDVAPHTTIGQILASVIMIMGYGILAVPTGIVSVEIAEANRSKPHNTEVCPSCLMEGHAEDAVFCRICGCRM